MKTTDNRLYGVIHNDATPAPPVFAPEIDVGGGSSLLDQMDRAFLREVMLLHAMKASRALASVVDEPPTKLEGIVGDLSKLKLVQQVNQADPETITMAVAAASIMMTARQGGQTALEKVEGALKLLSDRYQADW